MAWDAVAQEVIALWKRRPLKLIGLLAVVLLTAFASMAGYAHLVRTADGPAKSVTTPVGTTAPEVKPTPLDPDKKPEAGAPAGNHNQTVRKNNGTMIQVN